MAACPDENDIVAFATGSLDRQGLERIEAHLDTCADCSAMLSDAAAVVGDTAGAEAPTRGVSQRDAKVGQALHTSSVLPRGTSLGRYVVLELLATGGLGQVYVAYDPELDRKVALKLLRPSKGGTRPDHAAQRWLLREAQAMAKLSHPNVCPVHDVGTFGDDVFIAMELIDGQTFSAWLAEAPRTWREARDRLLDAGFGLVAAHEAGLVHRDFKPGNILLGRDGRVRVVDFGLARAVAGPQSRPQAHLAAPEALSERLLEEPLTQTGLVVGTPAYMAPEQFAGGDIDARVDQFAFCVTLYKGVYGKRPFEADDFATLRRVVEAGEVSPAPANRSVPAWLRRAILRGLRPDPDERHPSMRALLHELTRDRRSRRVQWLGLSLSAVLGATLATVLLKTEPSQSDKEAVDAIVAQARAAAARAYFIYPPRAEPDYETAYEHVVTLESLPEPQTELGRVAAQELRTEFARTLTRLGDAYWTRDGGAPFAADYYSAAVVFDPEIQPARDRTRMTPGQLASLTDKAKTTDFSESELIAAETLVALATPDEDERRRRVAALAARPTAPPASIQAQLTELVGSVDGATRDAPDTASDRRGDTNLHGADLPDPPASPQHSGPAGSRENREPTRQGPSENEPSAEPISATPRNPEAAKEQVRLGRVALDQGQARQAAEHFHRALAHDPGSAAALSGLAEVHFERSEFSQAVRFGERAVRASPKNARSRLMLGDAYLKVLRYPDAKRAYEKAKDLGHAAAQGRLDLLEKKMGE